MSESFKYGSVGGVGGNPGPYPEQDTEYRARDFRTLSM